MMNGRFDFRGGHGRPKAQPKAGLVGPAGILKGALVAPLRHRSGCLPTRSLPHGKTLAPKALLEPSQGCSDVVLKPDPR
ncbi:hypothetical protein D0544_08995 [Aestuariirhabdus litorea]|uniref:Uncharacterized protein n=1 Tax=Aestuariirhabdus litorea TaxID=2528527 RepID=A0A3P3VRW0_9GAMM|nr:hypothetical protein D0544_08995 [Aestuariirhabdus litorea]